jgi:cobalamin synthase
LRTGTGGAAVSSVSRQFRQFRQPSVLVVQPSVLSAVSSVSSVSRQYWWCSRQFCQPSVPSAVSTGGAAVSSVSRQFRQPSVLVVQPSVPVLQGNWFFSPDASVILMSGIVLLRVCSVALGQSTGDRTGNLQDILRLLTLWFTWGSAPDVEAALQVGATAAPPGLWQEHL